MWVERGGGGGGRPEPGPEEDATSLRESQSGSGGVVLLGSDLPIYLERASSTNPIEMSMLYKTTLMLCSMLVPVPIV